MRELAWILIPTIVGGILVALLVYAGVFLFTSLLIAGVFLLVVAAYDKFSVVVTVPGVTGWWAVVGVVSVLISFLGYSKGLLTLVP